jgi:hypothetical protein
MVATTEVEIIIGMFANLLSEVAVSEGAMAECGIVTALFAVAEVWEGGMPAVVAVKHPVCNKGGPH